MNKLSIAAVGALLVLGACQTETKKTPNGFEFQVVKAGDGVLPKKGEYLVFDYIMKDSKDSVWDDSYKKGFPVGVPIGDTTFMKSENGIMQMFRQLSKGDSVTFTLPVKKFFEAIHRPFPPTIDSTLSISNYFKVHKVQTQEDYMKDSQAFYEKKMEEQLQKDITSIDNYLASNSIKADTTSSGLRYVIKQAGTGDNAQPGQNVKVHYAGYLLDGTYFDTSIKALAQEKGLYDARREPYDPFSVVVERSNVIRGWHEALKLMNKGSKATFYIPSTLGYGPQRAGEKIAENSVLVFDIEMVDITDPEKESVKGGKPNVRIKR